MTTTRSRKRAIYPAARWLAVATTAGMIGVSLNLLFGAHASALTAPAASSRSIAMIDHSAGTYPADEPAQDPGAAIGAYEP